MKNLLFTVLVIILLSSALLSAQGVITGTILDNRTQEALPGVNILVLDTERGAATDLDGTYTISDVPFGTHRVEISFIGYETKIISDVVVTSAKAADVSTGLSEQVFEGDAIVVTGGYFVEEKRTQPSVLGLSREEIRRFPGGFEDVVRTVSTLPGVAVNTDGGRNDLIVRGGGPSENLYIVNNIEVPNINHFGSQGSSSGSLSFVNLDFVDDVTFSTGGFNARYGDKMSSVLQLEMNEGRSDQLGAKALVSATQFGFNGEGPLGDDANFIFSARKSYLDLIFKAAGLPFIPVYTDFNLLSTWKPSDKDRIVFIGLAAVDRVERDQSSEQNRVTNAGIMSNAQDQIITGVDYRRLLDHGYLDATVNYNRNDFRFRQANENLQEYFRSDALEEELGVKLQHFWALNKQIGISSGVSSKLLTNNSTTTFADSIYDRNGRKISIDQFGIPARQQNASDAVKSAAFVETDWLISDSWKANLGIRYDNYSFLNDPGYLAPRAAVTWSPSVLMDIKFSAGTYYQSPSYVWTLNEANKNLKALRNDMAVIGINYLLRDDTRLSFETYYKNYSNLPTGTLPGVTDHIVITNTGTGYGGRDDDFQSFGYFPMVSQGKGNAYGFELMLQKRFSDVPCYGQFSLSYSKSDLTAGNGKTYPNQYDQRFILNLSGGYILNRDWEFSAKFRYFTGVPYTPVYRPAENPIQPGTIQNIPQEYLAGRLEAGHHLDVRVDRYFLFNSWTLIAFVDIQNIYNYKIPLRPTYDFWTDEINGSSSLGILPSIGISAEF